MRFVPAMCLQPGMLLGLDLYGMGNELMLARGITLCETTIMRIRRLRYQGAYVIDDISEDIDVQMVISTHLKNNTVRAVKEIYADIQTQGEQAPARIDALKNLLEDIVEELIRNKNATVNMMDLKIFDDYTYFHSVNVAVLSIIMGAAMDMGKGDLYNLGLGALLHDIGKVFVPKELLEKNGKLTPAEYAEIKKHSLMGSWYLREKWEVPGDANGAVLCHHEKYDGSGYPYGLKTEKIPRYGKIVAVADVYDALTSDRPYRKAMLPSEAMEYVMGGCGTQFDPVIVELFASKVSPYPVGTCVMLSNGETAIVVENYAKGGSRPRVRVLSGGKSGEIFDLLHDRSLFCVTITGIAAM